MVSQLLSTSRQHQGLEDMLRKEAKKIGLAEHRALAEIQGGKKRVYDIWKKGQAGGRNLEGPKPNENLIWLLL